MHPLLPGVLVYFNDDVTSNVSVEVIRPDDPDKNEATVCGVEAHSHDRLKRSLKLKFRSKYGAKEWKTSLIEDGPVDQKGATDKHKTMVLRGGNNRAWTRTWNPDATCFIEDEFYRSSFLASSGVGSRGTFVHLYLNGVYWGVYNLVERIDDDWANEYLGGNNESWFYARHSGYGKNDPSRWEYLIGELSAKDMANETNYEEMQRYLNVKDFIDYLLTSFYVGLTDWPGNNWYVVLRNEDDMDGPTAAQFLAWDGEWSLDRRLELGTGAKIPDIFKTGSKTSNIPIVRLWFSLLASQSFRSLFAERVRFHVGPTGAFNKEVAISRWNALSTFIESAIVGESARWGDSLKSLGGEYAFTRTRDEDWRNQVDSIRTLLSGNTDQLLDELVEAGLFEGTTYPDSIRSLAPIAAITTAPVSLLTNAPSTAPVTHVPASAPSPGPTFNVLSGAPTIREVPTLAPSMELISSLFTFILVDSDTGGDIESIKEGSTFSLALTGTSLNIRAQPEFTGDVSSIFFVYDAGLLERTENIAPFAMAGDLRGVYNSWTPTLGKHTIQVTAYSRNHRGGAILGECKVNFQVIA